MRALYLTSAALVCFVTPAFGQASSGLSRGSADKPGGYVSVLSNGKANPATLPAASGGVPYSAVIGGTGSTPNVAGLDGTNKVPLASLYTNVNLGVPVYDSNGKLTLLGALAGTTATFSGVFTAGSFVGSSTNASTFAGPIQGTSETLSGNSSAANFTGTGTATSVFGGPISAPAATVNGNANVTGTLTAAGITSTGTQTSVFAGPISAPGFTSPSTATAAFNGPVTAPSFATSGSPNTVNTGTISTNGTGVNAFAGQITAPSVNISGQVQGASLSISGTGSFSAITDSGGISSTSFTVPDTIAGNLIVSGGGSSGTITHIMGPVELGETGTAGGGVAIQNGAGVAGGLSVSGFLTVNAYTANQQGTFNVVNGSTSISPTTPLVFVTVKAGAPTAFSINLDPAQTVSSTVHVLIVNGQGSNVTMTIVPPSGDKIDDVSSNNFTLGGGEADYYFTRAATGTWYH